MVECNYWKTISDYILFGNGKEGQDNISGGHGGGEILHHLGPQWASNQHEPLSTGVVTKPTIGMDFSTKVCCGCTDQYKLQLWDTAGQEKFRSIMPSYIRNSKIAVLVYDVTCKIARMQLPRPSPTSKSGLKCSKNPHATPASSLSSAIK